MLTDNKSQIPRRLTTNYIMELTPDLKATMYNGLTHR